MPELISAIFIVAALLLLGILFSTTEEIMNPPDYIKGPKHKGVE